MARDEYIRIYRSTVEGAVPSLTSGEIATNLADGKLFIGGSNGDLITYPQNPIDANSLSGSIESLSVHSGNVFLSLPIRTNLIKHSQDYVTSAFDLWNAYGSVSTVTNLGNATDSGWPNGSTGGISLVFAANANNGIYQKIPDIVKNQVYTVSCWARSSSGTEKARFSYYDDTLKRSTFSPDYTLTTTPQRVSFTFRAQSNNNVSNIAFGNGSGNVGGTVLAWGFQLEQGWIATNPIHNDTGAPKQSSAQVIPVSSSTGVTSFNGLTGTVSLTGDGSALFGYENNRIGARLGSYTLTGVASFDPRYFGIGLSGHLVLTGAYQVTGDTVQAGYGINLGAGKFINNTGVTSFNGLTGNVSLTGDGSALFGYANNRIGARLGSYTLTGVASFDPRHFGIGTSGHLVLTGAYQVTGDTVQAGYGINLGAGKFINNTGVTSFNGLTGNVSLTGDGSALQGKENNRLTVRMVTDNAVTGVASFDAAHFTVATTGHVRSKGVMTINSLAPDGNGNFTLAAATVVTGDGGAIQGKSDAFITARIATDSLTGVASFGTSYFDVTQYGAVSIINPYITFQDSDSQVNIYSLGNAVGQYRSIKLSGMDGVSARLVVGGSTPINEYTIRNTGVTSFNGLTGTVTLTGDGSALFGYGNNRIGARLGSYTLTGVASFDPRYFGIGLSGHLVLTGAYQVTGDTVQAGYGINLGAGKFINNTGVTSFNGLTGNVSLTGDGSALFGYANNRIGARLGSYTLTGVASFDPRYFGIGTSGHLVLTGSYQVTGDTVQAGYGINIGTGKFINNTGVTSFNGLTGNVSLTGDGSALFGYANNRIGARLGSYTLTGVASFDPRYFGIGLSGHLVLTGAYQVTGDTVQAGYGINIGTGKFINNTGVTSFNGLTGNVSLTGDGSALFGYGNNRIGARLGSYTLTGVASFDPRYFGIGLSGHLVLTGAYQVTGDTVITVAGSGIGIATNGKTDTLYNIGVTGIGFGNDLGLTGKVNITAGSNITITRSGNTITVAGQAQQVTAVTGDGGAIQGRDNAYITSRIATSSLTGVAAFNDAHFSINEETGHVGLLYPYDPTYVAFENTSNVFTSKQYFTAGISADSVLVGRGLTYTQIGYRQFDIEEETRYSIIETNDTKGLYLASNSGTASTAILNPNGIFLGHNGVGGFAQVSIGLADALGQAIAQSNYNSRLVLSSADGLGGSTIHRISSNTSLSTPSGTYDLYLPNSSGTFALTRNLVATLNGLTGVVSLTGDGQAVQGKSNNTITARVATDSLTGVASFDPVTLTADANGKVTVRSITILDSIGTQGIFLNGNPGGSVTTFTGNAGLSVRWNGASTLSFNNTGVIEFNGLTGNVSLTGDGNALFGYANNRIGARLGSYTLTGVASFDPRYFGIGTSGHLVLTGAYQVTGDTVQAGYGINIGAGKTINNTGVTSFNGLTGNVSLTGDGGALQGKANNRLTVRMVTDNAVTGVASFDAAHFTVATTGHVRSKGVMTINGSAPDSNGNFTVAAATVVTGDGGAIQGKSDAFITARLGSYTLTGVASFDPRYFGIGLSGHLVLTGAYQVTGDTVQAGYGINIGTGKFINNTGVTSFNGLTGNVSLTGDGSALFGYANNRIGARLGSYTLTGVASFDPRYFGIGTSGHLVLTGAYQVTGDTIITVAGSGIGIVTNGKTDTLYNIGVTSFNGLTGARTLTGDGWAIRGVGNNAITALTGGCGFTGVVGVDCTKFVINGDGIITGLVAGPPGGGGSCDPDNPPTNQQDCVDCGGQWLSNFPNPGGTCLLSLAPSYSGLGVSAGADGTISYFYFDAGNLTFSSATTLDPTNDFVVFYDSSHTGLVKTKRIKADRILLDNDSIFFSKSSQQFVKSKSSTNIEFEVLTAVVTPGEEKLLKSGDAYTYITQNTVKSLNGQTGDVAVVGSLNGCTGTITITGTANEVVVSNSCPTITIGLPDNVSIPYLSGTGATFTQTVTATRFIGIVSGGDF